MRQERHKMDARTADETTTVTVRLPSRTYDVSIGAGLLGAPQIWADHARGGRLVFVADERVWRLHGANVEDALSQAGIAPQIILRRAGERLKSWSALHSLIDELLDLNLDRSDPIVALGGGVIGDLAGFAASILKRGCPVIQAPTTLLAQVDSAVGGKTGINWRHGKNLVGTFHQPSAVIADTDVLRTLPLRHRRNGLAEVIKYGLIADGRFFEWCEGNAEAVLAGDRDALMAAVSTCVRIKAEIVADDERDLSGRRALLNFGHSFGHALEAATCFSSRLLHGEAVAIGMVLALKLSARLGTIEQDLVHRVERLIHAVGLPSNVRRVAPDLDARRMLELMRQDKKAVAGIPALVLAKGLGSAFVSNDVPEAQLRSFLEQELSGEVP